MDLILLQIASFDLALSSVLHLGFTFKSIRVLCMVGKIPVEHRTLGNSHAHRQRVRQIAVFESFITVKVTTEPTQHLDNS